MEWRELHDLNLCKEVLVVEPWKHPYPSKERADLWNEIAATLNACDHPKIKVSKRSFREADITATKIKSENENGGSCFWDRLRGDNHREREGGHGCEKPTR